MNKSLITIMDGVQKLLEEHVLDAKCTYLLANVIFCWVGHVHDTDSYQTSSKMTLSLSPDILRDTQKFIFICHLK